MDASRWTAATLAAAQDGWPPSCSGSPAAPQGRDPARRQAPTPTGEPNHFADLASGGSESHITKPGRATAPGAGNSLLPNLLLDVQPQRIPHQRKADHDHPIRSWGTVPGGPRVVVLTAWSRRVGPVPLAVEVLMIGSRVAVAGMPRSRGDGPAVWAR